MPPFRKNRFLLCELVGLFAGPKYAIGRIFLDNRLVGVLERGVDVVEVNVANVVGVTGHEEPVLVRSFVHI